ncbi:MAG: ribose 5-phosphate isomerase B [Candidatus Kapabacteria bacterium]|nr:ribose 5-phosphate isomerase B [Candidatus Kapabacteria bacterium]
MTISIGSDHAGFAYKEALKAMLVAEGHEVIDVGTHSEERADYPDYGVAAARLVANGTARYGVLVCGSGIGISIAANKVHGIRAANCVTVEMAQLARQHNDANMVAIGQRLVSEVDAKAIVKAFLTTDFEGGRHAQRVEKIHALGEGAPS